MKYCLYRLKFKTAVHIGDDSGKTSLASSEMTIHADTLFSALCYEALQCGGQELLDKLCSAIKTNDLLLSDALPYNTQEYFLPKPIMKISRHREQSDSSLKKKFKALKYIPVSQFENYLGSLNNKNTFDPDNVCTSFGNQETITRAAIKGVEETNPYHVGVYRFFDNCGLYIIIAYKENEKKLLFKRLLNALSFSGIGGKRTSGLGKFEIVEEIELDKTVEENALKILSEMLTDNTSDFHMGISISLPKEEELDTVTESGFYSLIRRGGFVQSQSYSDTPLKKKIIYLFSAGSCFKQTYEGDIYDVSFHGSHPVYRYAKPVFVGVKI
ncbi:MAG: type III-A CRISPR-associated RAMP protein Csm4 [Eubacteriales bacterium]